MKTHSKVHLFVEMKNPKNILDTESEVMVIILQKYCNFILYIYIYHITFNFAEEVFSLSFALSIYKKSLT